MFYVKQVSFIDQNKRSKPTVLARFPTGNQVLAASDSN